MGRWYEEILFIFQAAFCRRDPIPYGHGHCTDNAVGMGFDGMSGVSNNFGSFRRRDANGRMPMEYSSIVSYIWLNEAFLVLFNTWHADNDIVLRCIPVLVCAFLMPYLIRLGCPLAGKYSYCSFLRQYLAWG